VNTLSALRDRLRSDRRIWLVTGSAGFIGSHLVEFLLSSDQAVLGMDNFLTGHQKNVDMAVAAANGVGAFRQLNGDIRDFDACKAACSGVDIVLHQAALGSVARSIDDPMPTHACNVDGFLNILRAAQAASIRRVVYASSSSVYGDHAALPKRESQTGKPLSPYALSKDVNERYADLFFRLYGIETIGLRYFNVFGARQDPRGPYAAVIPRWIMAARQGQQPIIFGDGQTSRDFCYVDNAVQANILAATTRRPDALGETYNIAAGHRTTLKELWTAIRDQLKSRGMAATTPVHRPERAGDIRHSLADISKAKELLEYCPEFSVREGLGET
jgi:UDP-N-acetylglucosamine/UDP-N-acetylgalactosamine 4-epimerase